MHPRRPQTMFFLIAVILLTGLLAGCGGGDQSGDGESAGKKKQGVEAAKKGEGVEAAKKGDGKVAKQGVSRPKIALGTVKRVKPERRKVVIRAVTGRGVEKPMPFKISRNATITLDNEQAELTDIKDGQQAQITYLVINELNLAREVTLISDD